MGGSKKWIQQKHWVFLLFFPHLKSIWQWAVQMVESSFVCLPLVGVYGTNPGPFTCPHLKVLRKCTFHRIFINENRYWTSISFLDAMNLSQKDNWAHIYLKWYYIKHLNVKKVELQQTLISASVKQPNGKQMNTKMNCVVGFVLFCS